ncbi:MAG: hypothetical protein WBB42_04880 [Polyangiales bacterium]
MQKRGFQASIDTAFVLSIHASLKQFCSERFTGRTPTMKFVFSMTLALALLATAPALAQDKIDVMTQNQYLGADLTPIITAPNPAAFNDALISALQQIAANDYPARSKQLAGLIADRLPELVGLQEMFAFTCLDTPTPGDGCAEPSFSNAFNDHLDLTLTELAELDETYVDVAIIENLNITLPVFLDNDEFPDILVTVLDRDVVLARADVQAAPVPFSAICGQGPLPGVPGANGSPGCNYENIAEVDTSLGVPVKVQRGFVGVDAIVGGKVYRFVNTHLEVKNLVPAPLGTPPGVIPGGSIQAAQATELNVLVATSLASLPNPLGAVTPIIVGDINSGPTDEVFVDPLFPIPNAPLSPPYMQLANGVDLLGQGPWGLGPLTDAWDLRPGAVPGYSCCQADNLSNHQSELDHRIDVIFSKEMPSKVKKARVLGAKVSDKTSPPGQGLWPSDHGSVAAELEF